MAKHQDLAGIQQSRGRDLLEFIRYVFRFASSNRVYKG